MTTIILTFESGFVGTLTHHDPKQIREWLRIFDNPEAMDYCGIVGISVRSLYSEAA
jgi:hypothetical protein